MRIRLSSFIILFFVISSTGLSAQEESPEPLNPTTLPAENLEQETHLEENMTVDSLREARERAALMQRREIERAHEARKAVERERRIREERREGQEKRGERVPPMFGSGQGNPGLSPAISKGEEGRVTSNVGGDLMDRGTSEIPEMVHEGQETGRVIVSICVAADGTVISEAVRVTLQGTTTSNSQLHNAAIKNAKEWRFTSSEIDRQCGIIIYTFVVEE